MKYSQIGCTFLFQLVPRSLWDIKKRLHWEGIHNFMIEQTCVFVINSSKHKCCYKSFLWCYPNIYPLLTCESSLIKCCHFVLSNSISFLIHIKLYSRNVLEFYIFERVNNACEYVESLLNLNLINSLLVIQCFLLLQGFVVDYNWAVIRKDALYCD